MSYLSILRSLPRSKRAPIFYNHPFFPAVRPISTSSKGSEISQVSVETDAKQILKRKKVRPFQSYGYDLVDQVKDVFWMHVTSFGMVVLILSTVTFIAAYYPDLNDQDWYVREAYMEIRRREVLGLPMIDKDFIDPANIRLPPDEELGEFDIII